MSDYPNVCEHCGIASVDFTLGLSGVQYECGSDISKFATVVVHSQSDVCKKLVGLQEEITELKGELKKTQSWISNTTVKAMMELQRRVDADIEAEKLCRCELGARAWNPTTRSCETCGTKY